jgi:hypothetical protein
MVASLAALACCDTSITMVVGLMAPVSFTPMRVKTQPSWDGVDGAFGVMSFLKVTSGISTMDIGSCLVPTARTSASLPDEAGENPSHLGLASTVS